MKLLLTINRYRLFMLVVAMLLLNQLACTSQEPGRVSVVGTAVEEVDADQVRWHLSLRSEGEKSDVLAEKHAQKLSQLLAYLKQEALAEKHIKTEQMHLSENWNYENGKRFRQGYVANTGLVFVSSLEAYTSLWKGLARFDGLSIDGTHFELSNQLEQQQRVRNEALLVAQKKARAMANTLGADIGKPLYIEDLNWGDDVHVPQTEMKMMSRNSSPDIVAPGKLEIRMRVKVDFEIR